MKISSSSNSSFEPTSFLSCSLGVIFCDDGEHILHIFRRTFEILEDVSFFSGIVFPIYIRTETGLYSFLYGSKNIRDDPLQSSKNGRPRNGICWPQYLIKFSSVTTNLKIALTNLTNPKR